LARILTWQRNVLIEAGCERIFLEQMSGAVTDRPELMAATVHARSGDT
jgi:DNA invertase Pin-like site-specific DNA recombinase